MITKYRDMSSETEVLKRRIKEKERFAAFLEKEVSKRNEEIESLVSKRIVLSRALKETRHVLSSAFC